MTQLRISTARHYILTECHELYKDYVEQMAADKTGHRIDMVFMRIRDEDETGVADASWEFAQHCGYDPGTRDCDIVNVYRYVFERVFEETVTIDALDMIAEQHATS